MQKFLTVILLSIMSIPWYLDQGAHEPIIFGFPLWAFISLIFNFILAAYIAWVVHKWN